MKKCLSKSKEGVTLIELMVIVAIVGLLASIVIVNVVEARDKARNAYTIQTIQQYVNALELYRDKHGGYPKVGSDGDSACLGRDPVGNGGECFDGTMNETRSDALKVALSEYIGGWETPNPVKTDSEHSPGSAYVGYACDDVCDNAVLFWTMQNVDESCRIPDATMEGFVITFGNAFGSSQSVTQHCRLILPLGTN